DKTRRRGGSVRILQEERPTDATRDLLKAGAMLGELALVGRPQGLHAVRDPTFARFRGAKLDAALVGQGLFRGIENLHDMAKNAALGHGVEALGDGGRRVE